MPTTDQFLLLRRLADRLAGIDLLDRHREIMSRRIVRVGLDESGLMTLMRQAEEGDQVAGRRLIGLLVTGHTSFFRHQQQIELAAEHALWTVHRRGQARLWSAAAASGEEPWSLAMAVQAVFGCDRPAVSILASDIDGDALAVAEAGIYGAAAIAAIPEAYRRGIESIGGGGRIAGAVRPLVRFERLNLVDLAWPVEGPLDVILCRNVLMYLGADHRYAILERIASLLAPDGLLLLDPSEHLGTASHFFTSGSTGVYGLRRHTRPQRVPA